MMHDHYGTPKQNMVPVFIFITKQLRVALAFYRVPNGLEIQNIDSLSQPVCRNWCLFFLSTNISFSFFFARILSLLIVVSLSRGGYARATHQIGSLSNPNFNSYVLHVVQVYDS